MLLWHSAAGVANKQGRDCHPSASIIFKIEHCETSAGLVRTGDIADLKAAHMYGVWSVKVLGLPMPECAPACQRPCNAAT